jgi:predicted ester cyclase
VAIEPSDGFAVVKQIVAQVNGGDLTSVCRFVAPQFQAAMMETGPLVRRAFPDLRIAVEDMFGAGDRYAVRWTAMGTHRGDATHPLLGTVKATGRSINVSGVSILQIENGMIVNTWGATNELSTLSQLGLLPKFFQ